MSDIGFYHPLIPVAHGGNGRRRPALRFRHGWLTADALEALGQTDMAGTTLQQLRTEFPDSARLRRRLDTARSNAS